MTGSDVAAVIGLYDIPESAAWSVAPVHQFTEAVLPVAWLTDGVRRARAWI